MHSGVYEQMNKSKFSDKYSNIIDEISGYREMNVTVAYTNYLEFWENNKATFPRLYRIARNILVITASSAEAERFFFFGWEYIGM